MVKVISKRKSCIGPLDSEQAFKRRRVLQLNVTAGSSSSRKDFSDIVFDEDNSLTDFSSTLSTKPEKIESVASSYTDYLSPLKPSDISIFTLPNKPSYTDITNGLNALIDNCDPEKSDTYLNIYQYIREKQSECDNIIDVKSYSQLQANCRIYVSKFLDASSLPISFLQFMLDNHDNMTGLTNDEKFIKKDCGSFSKGTAEIVNQLLMKNNESTFSPKKKLIIAPTNISGNGSTKGNIKAVETILDDSGDSDNNESRQIVANEQCPIITDETSEIVMEQISIDDAAKEDLYTPLKPASDVLTKLTPNDFNFDTMHSLLATIVKDNRNAEETEKVGNCAASFNTKLHRLLLKDLDNVPSICFSLLHESL